MNNYKVCILAAGTAKSMGSISENINRALLPVNFKATISYIMEKFPENVEIVVAVGHKKETVKDYVALAHPERKITFVEIDKYVGPGTGPGYSLLKCKDYLQCPFIFFAADTLVLEEIPAPNENWFGIAPVKETENFCTVKIKNNLIYQLDDKIKTDNKFAFIGLAGVNDYELFFSALENNKDPISGEIQVSNGFKKLIEKRLVPISFTWFDTGSLASYIETNNNFSGGEKKFDFSKTNEFLYFVNDRVIKFFADAETAKTRFKRGRSLNNLVPELEDLKGNFYSYKKIDGQVLYNLLNTQIVNDFLQWSKKNLWKNVELDETGQKEFYEACKNFYHEKTMKRIKKFYEKTGLTDEWNYINGVHVPPLENLFAKMDWEELFNGTPSTFHGDLQFDNVLVTRNEVSNLQKFVLLDWRENFGGLVHVGDLYYDLAKLYGGMIISYQLIKEGKLSFDMSGSSVYYKYLIKNDLMECKEEYELFLKKNKFDLQKIKVLTSLIFLNMSPLHNDPFDLMLYFMGKSLLYKTLKELESGNNKEAVKNGD